MAEPYQALGRRLLAIRREMAAREGSGLSQRLMADRLAETWIDGVSATQTQVSRWEKGKARPRRATLAAYARLAGENEERLLRLAGYGHIADAVGTDEIDRTEGIDEDSPPGVARTLGRPTPKDRRGPGRSRNGWLVALASLVLLLVAWVLYRGQQTSNPTLAWIGGDRLEVLAGKHRLWSLGLPRPVQPRVEPLVRDLDLDGRNEVLVSLDPAEPARESGRLVCFSDDGTERWEFRYGRPLVIGERRFSPYFVAQHLAWLGTPGSAFILLVARHERWFPAQVVLLDPRSGAVVGEYWHPGYIEVFTTFDLGSDGTIELLLGGINNPGHGPGMPSLAVLDLPFRPATGPDAVFGLTHASERAYLLFPRPDLHRVYTELASLTTLRAEGDGRLLAGISTPAGNALFYTLDSRLAVVDLRVSDTFIHNHDRLLDHRYSPEERQGWRDLLRCPRAPDANRLQRSPTTGLRPGA